MTTRHLSPRHLRLAALTLTVALPASALAQDAITLDPVVISGGFSPIEAQSYGRAATTLDGEDLRERGFTSVQDALRTVPGVSISATGHGLTQTRIRGAEANHTMILIDGIEAAAGDDEYYLSGLDTANIERIEVLRGPQSVFYGASAAAGVINIITNRPADGGRAGLEFGNGLAGWLSTGISGERGRLSFSYSGRDDDGYDVSGDGGEDDGIRRHNLTVSGDTQATDDLRLGFSLRRADEHYGYDVEDYGATSAEGFVVNSDDHTDRDELAGEIFAEHVSAGGRVVNRLSYQETQVDLSQNDGETKEARTRALRWRATIGLDGAVVDATQTLSFGIDRRKDENSLARNNERRNTSVAVEYRAALANGVDLQFGLRHDDNSVFQSKTSYVAAASWRIADTPFRLHASAGTGVVNPVYYELLGGFGLVGNPDLEPEENRSFDIGVETTFADGRGVIDVTWFNERLENEIKSDWMGLPDGTNYYNEDGTSRREGIEIAGRYDVTDALTLGLGYTYLDAKEPDGSVEMRRPRHELSMNAALRVLEGRGTISADLRHVRGNYDGQWWVGGAGVSKLDDYTVVNVSGSYDLTEKARIRGRVVNLFDEEYSDVWGYASPGRAAWLGVETRW
ncbi:TonB-dependent receptor [Paracoccus sp. Z118]|uniref:TonB-dependent receptor plug domain-containing protein n=1 Tax=Paracoccus sp. Z118 TaxID=2851017 RepID=UPI001C2B9DC2|nr:TonB-dependent receptor [Paracoccus sp. Z118]MBV0892440.1 TonB-dependent receptor [Paracoccus sp. Z118]